MTESSRWGSPPPPAPADPYATPTAPAGYAPAGYAPAGYAPPGATTGYAPPASPPPGYAPPGAPPAGWAPSRDLRPVTGLGYAVVVVSAVWLLLDVMEAVTAIGAAPRFAEAAERGTEQPLVVYDGVVALGGLASVVAFVVTCLWLQAVRRNVVAVAPGSQRRGVVWVWLGWLVPVVSLVFPLQVVSDLARASTRARLGLGAWWALFLVFLLVQRATGSMVGGFTGDVDPALVRALPVVEAVSAVVLLAAFVLWARIVLDVTAAQARWAATQQPTVL